MVNEVTKRGDPPIFEYIGPRDDEGNMQPVDREGNRLRIWPGETVVHNLWDVMFGRDRNRGVGNEGQALPRSRQ
jgi:hypothetical protein